MTQWYIYHFNLGNTTACNHQFTIKLYPNILHTRYLENHQLENKNRNQIQPIDTHTGSRTSWYHWGPRRKTSPVRYDLPQPYAHIECASTLNYCIAAVTIDPQASPITRKVSHKLSRCTILKPSQIVVRQRRHKWPGAANLLVPAITGQNPVTALPPLLMSRKHGHA
jgi:hypothetical protein